MNQVEADELFVLQIFRLFRQAVLHDLRNDAVQKTVQRSVDAFHRLIRHQQFRLSLVFWGDNVFINGHALRAVRSVYKSAVELGVELDRLGINEIIVESGVTENDIFGILTEYSHLRKQYSGTKLPPKVHFAAAEASGPNASPRTLMRYVDASLLMGYGERSLGRLERTVRACTSAAVVLERLYEQVPQGRYDLVLSLIHI